MASSSAGSLDALFETVRESGSRAAWSRGVELARAAAVGRAGEDGGELVLRVSVPGALISPTVRLLPADSDWHCDCGDPEDPCAHVAAAVIALRRAAREGRHELIAGRAGRLRYRLERRAGGLHLERAVVAADGSVVPLRSTLAALASGRVEGPEVAATRADFEVELALGTRLSGDLPREAMPRLLSALARCADVRLDGDAVRASGEPVRPRVRVEDRGEGFWVGFAADPEIRERFGNDAVLRGDTLRPVTSSTGLLGRDLALLLRGHVFEGDEIVRLVGELLPGLEGRVDLDVRTRRLPRPVPGVPRARVEVAREDGALCALATLVYGEPASARIDAGRLVHLGGPIPLRDEAAERRLEREIQQQLGLAVGHRVRVRGAEAVELAERLRGWSGEVRGPAHREFYRTEPLVPRLRVGASDFELSFEVRPAASGNGGKSPRRVSAEAVLRAWRDGESLVPLAGGGFAPLPADWLARLGPTVADLLAARGADGALPACSLPDLARLCEALEAPVPPAFEGMRRLVEGFAELPQAELPEDLRAELRGYQRDGVRWLAFLRGTGLGALLADDMGLGKTLQTLCVLAGRCLVVAPTSVLFNWEEEILRFRPGLRARLYHGPDRTLDAGADVTLTTYTLLRMDADRLCAVDWDCVVLDEAQNVKNPDSQAARAAYRLRAPYRIALSGTPVENRLDELWSQLHFLNPGLLGGRADFRARYARPVSDGDAQAAARLRRRLRPFVLRRTKAEVARELPPRTEMILRCELDETERAVYQAVRAATRREVLERLDTDGSVLGALEALLRLRQAACHSGLVPGRDAARSSKVKLLREELETAVADGHKALVFSQWTSLLDRVEPELRRAGIDRLRLDGSTRDRAGVVAAFQSAEGPPVLLVSLKAGGTGLNLTAADHVFLLDPWWNPAVEEQAADRAHRIGQERPVMVYRLVARETVEERILELQQRKRALAGTALAEAGAATGLTREDLLDLLA